MALAFLDELELQQCIATQAGILDAILVRRNIDQIVMLPREFPIPKLKRAGEYESIDCMAISTDGTIIIIECKLGKSPDLRKKKSGPPDVVNQITRYSDGLSCISPYRFSGALAAMVEKYGMSVKSHLTKTFGHSFDREKWIERVDRALKENRILAILAVDEISAVERDEIVSQAEKAKIELEIIRVIKDQRSENDQPVFASDVITTDQYALVAQRDQAISRPALLRYCDTAMLKKMQSRVWEVRPPRQLRVEHNWWHSRNANPEENHAVDPGRTASFIPIMPDVTLLTSTGSPYPDDDYAPTVFPYPIDYRPWLEIGREVWRVLQKTRVVESERDGGTIVSRSIARSKRLSDHPKLQKFGMVAVLGAIRDLSLFGIGSLYRLPSQGIRMNWRLRL